MTGEGKSKSKLDAKQLRFLSKAFLYPDENFLKDLKEIAGKNSTWTEILTEFQSLPLEELQAEYTALFISGYPHTPCPPHESVYLEQMAAGLTNEILLEIYASWGFSVDLVLADHVSTELEFLAFLLTASRVEGLSKTAKQGAELFLRNHLLRWAPRFASDLAREANLRIYRLLANSLSNMLESVV